MTPDKLFNRIQVAKGLNQTELAKKLGWSTSLVNKLAKSKRELNANHIYALAKLCGVHPESIKILLVNISPDLNVNDKECIQIIQANIINLMFTEGVKHDK